LALRSSWKRYIETETRQRSGHPSSAFSPYSALVNRFREIEHFKATQFVVIHTELLNYLQVNAGSVQVLRTTLRASWGVAGLTRIWE